MTILAVGYLATEIWLYASGGRSLSDSFLLDIPGTFGFVLLAAIAYAATGGDDDSA